MLPAFVVAALPLVAFDAFTEIEPMKSSQDIELSWVLLHDKVLRSECWVHPQAEVWWVEVCPSGLEISSILPNGR